MITTLKKSGPSDVQASPASIHKTGRVIGRSESSYLVESGSGVHEVKRAFSCLVQPEVGDTVLLTRELEEGDYILAILAREEGKKTQLVFEHDVEIKATKGHLEIAARDGLDLGSPGKVAVNSTALQVSTLRGSIGIDRLSLYGRLCQVRVSTVKLIADKVDTLAERIFSKAKQSYRFIEDSEHVRANNIDCRAKNSLRLRGKISQLSAENDVIVDGKMVHLA